MMEYDMIGLLPKVSLSSNCNIWNFIALSSFMLLLKLIDFDALRLADSLLTSDCFSHEFYGYSFRWWARHTQSQTNCNCRCTTKRVHFHVSTCRWFSTLVDIHFQDDLEKFKSSHKYDIFSHNFLCLHLGTFPSYYLFH